MALKNLICAISILLAGALIKDGLCQGTGGGTPDTGMCQDLPTVDGYNATFADFYFKGYLNIVSQLIAFKSQDNLKRCGSISITDRSDKKANISRWSFLQFYKKPGSSQQEEMNCTGTMLPNESASWATVLILPDMTPEAKTWTVVCTGGSWNSWIVTYACDKTSGKPGLWIWVKGSKRYTSYKKLKSDFVTGIDKCLDDLMNNKKVNFKKEDLVDTDISCG